MRAACRVQGVNLMEATTVSGGGPTPLHTGGSVHGRGLITIYIHKSYQTFRDASHSALTYENSYRETGIHTFRDFREGKIYIVLLHIFLYTATKNTRRGRESQVH